MAQVKFKDVRRWFSWLLFGALLGISPLFFIGGPNGVSSLLFNQLWNLGHIVFFAGAVFVMMQFLTLTSWKSWILISLGAVCLSAAIELLQKMVGRDASWDDVLHNLGGVWLALFFGQQLKVKLWIAIALRVLVVSVVAPSFWFTAVAAYTDVYMRKQFPVINNFETFVEAKHLVGIALDVPKTRSKAHVSYGQFSLAVNLGTEKYSGLKWVSPYGDWTAYNRFAMDIYNAEVEAVEVVLKIADFSHDLGNNLYDDRFNKRVTLLPGWNYLNVSIEEIKNAPANRSMRMDQISCLELFATRLAQPALIYIDYLRLE